MGQGGDTQKSCEASTALRPRCLTGLRGACTRRVPAQAKISVTGRGMLDHQSDGAAHRMEEAHRMVLPRRRPCLPRTGLVRRPSGPACVRPHAGRPQQEVRPSPHERDEQQHGRLEHCLVAPGSFAPRPAQCAMRAGDRCRAPGRSPRSGRNTCCSRSDGRSREQDEPMGDQDDARTMKTMKIPSYRVLTPTRVPRKKPTGVKKKPADREH